MALLGQGKIYAIRVKFPQSINAMSPALIAERRHPLDDRELIQDELTEILRLRSTPPSPLRRAMEYAVLGGGQRVRPVLSLRIARCAGVESPLTLRAAAAVEVLHCASLIIDDLPCMDDEELRRGRPATHRAFGEPTALLAAFGLVAAAARSVVEIDCRPTELSALVSFQIRLLQVMDVSGLCEGQDLDLRTIGLERVDMRAQIIEMKTVPLFVLAAEAGLLGLNPGSPAARALRAFARDFGLAFQLADDYADGEIDDLGLVEDHLRRARAHLQPLNLPTAPLNEMLNSLYQRCLESHAHRR